MTELCALYFSRSILQALTGAPFLDDVDRAFMKLERALPVASRKFLDRFPSMLKAKSSSRKKHDEKKTREILARAIDASLRQRRVEMRYDSSSSKRTKNYTVDPLRLSYAQGGIYLIAWVDEYQQVRTFAVERIRTLAVLDEHFEPRPLPTEPFADSLGIHTGKPESIEVEFDKDVADFVSEREWHQSPATGTAAGWLPAGAADGLRRPSAAQLDPQLRSTRPRARTSPPGARSVSRNRGYAGPLYAGRRA